MKSCFYYPALALWLLTSSLPLRVHYFFSDWLLFPLLFHIIRYRRRLVARQLADSLPELGEQELRAVERRFYHTLCDYVVETLKMATMSPGEIRRRVEFTGVDTLQELMAREGKLINLTYLGHFGNWEWMSSVALHMLPAVGFSQVYHPLHNALLDRLMRRGRERFGGECVSMRETLRHILRVRGQNHYEIVGLIADQCPKWEATHQWCTFLHHDTSFLVGGEVIGKRVDAVITYLDVSRPSRGHYKADVKILTTQPNTYKDFELTELYARTLEESIRRAPHLWLWTHDRWKRSHEEWLQRGRQ
ncbi:MAG: lysophospholipid acyltransferase family protein [Prevotellaceae bacterium]|nr:lysophospholipid acyltransferase family protein [Prevotellaceae bacterium]